MRILNYYGNLFNIYLFINLLKIYKLNNLYIVSSKIKYIYNNEYHLMLVTVLKMVY